jgi:hypothetical protein
MVTQAPGLQCPACGWEDHEVVDTHRSVKLGGVRRRRRCLHCSSSWNTIELRMPISSEGVYKTASYDCDMQQEARSLATRQSVSVRLPKELTQRLAAIAEAEGNHTSAVVRRLLSKAIVNESEVGK